MSFKTVFAASLHFLSCAVMIWGYLGLDVTVMNTFIVKQKGGHFQFLTIQALLIAGITNAISLCADFFPGSTFFKNTKRIFFMIAMPLSTVVTVIYWSLLLLLPSLILQAPPSSGEPSSAPQALILLPLPLDLSLHAVPALSLLLDFFLLEQSYSRHAVTRIAPLTAIAFGLWYSTWVEYCASYNKTFPYPFLTLNPFHTRVVIYGVVTCIAFLSFRGINHLHKTIYGHGVSHTKSD